MNLDDLKKPFPEDRIHQQDLERFNEKWEPVTESGCWIWTGAVTGNGYGSFWLNGGYYGSHRISYSFFNGDIPDGMVVCHNCDNPLCVNPSHLFAGTHQDNMNDRNKKLRQAHGERNNAAKLTEKEIEEIRTSSLRSVDLAEKYGMHRSSIWRIKTKRNWSKV